MGPKKGGSSQEFLENPVNIIIFFVVVLLVIIFIYYVYIWWLNQQQKMTNDISNNKVKTYKNTPSYV